MRPAMLATVLANNDGTTSPSHGPSSETDQSRSTALSTSPSAKQSGVSSSSSSPTSATTNSTPTTTSSAAAAALFANTDPTALASESADREYEADDEDNANGTEDSASDDDDDDVSSVRSFSTVSVMSEDPFEPIPGDEPQSSTRRQPLDAPASSAEQTTPGNLASSEGGSDPEIDLLLIICEQRGYRWNSSEEGDL